MIDFDTHDLNRKIPEENFAFLPLKLPPITSFLHFRLFEAMKNNSWLVFFLFFLNFLLSWLFSLWFGKLLREALKLTKLDVCIFLLLIVLLTVIYLG